MCEEGWCVGLGLEGVGLCEGGGNYLKYLERGWNRKERRGNNDFKKGEGYVFPRYPLSRFPGISYQKYSIENIQKNIQ